MTNAFRYLATSVFACLSLLGTAAAQVQGTPWTGDAGIRLTTDELAIAQRSEDARTAGVVRPPRIKPFLKADRAGNPSAPGAPDVSTFPAETSALVRVTGGPKAAQTLSAINFTGATLADTNAFPPDSMGAVGPTQFIVAVNGRVRSFDKTTGVADGVLNVTTDTFFASVMTPPIANNFSSDPRIRYDRLSGRWFITMIDVPGGAGALPNRVMVAASDTSTVTGATVWTFFQFQQDLVAPAGDTGSFADYPSLGIDANALYIGVNIFSSSGSYAGTTAFVVRKTSVLGAGPIVVTAFRNLTGSPTGAGPFAPQGVDNFDPAATVGYFVGVDNAAFSLLQLRRITNPGGTPSISANIPLTVPTTRFPANVPHLGNTGGTNGLLDGLDDRLYSAQIRNGQLWTAHNIGTNAAGTATTTTSVLRNAVRWYQIGSIGTTPAVTQSGTVVDAVNGNGSNANWYWVPSLNVNGQGHAAVGFSAAGVTRADAAFTGRLATDTLGTMPGPLTRITNTTFAYNPPLVPGNSNPRRWGDFSYTSVDPLDDMSMWTIQEFTDATNSYGVRVAKLNAPPPATPASASPASIAAGQASVNVTVTGTSTGGSGFFDPGTDLAPPAVPFRHIAASVTGGVTVNSVTYVSPTSVTLNVSTVGASAGAQSITITNPDGQALTGSGILAITKTDQTITFGPLADKTYGDPPFTVTATGGGSGNPVTFSAAPPTVCTVAGNLVTLTGAGTCTITADQAGSATYNPAPSVPQSFQVAQATQTIVFGALPNKTFGDPPFSVSATGGASGNPVTFSSLTTGVCTVSGSTVTIVAAGPCTIAADQAGNANYLAAPQVTQGFTVAQAAQTIVFGALPNKTFGDPPFSVSATGGASGNPVTFSSLTNGICTVSGSTVTIVAAGPCTIAADQAGNANYIAAPQVTQGFTVAQATQTIVFGALPNKTFGDPPFGVNATGGASGNPVTFSSLTTGVCTVGGSTVTLVAPGLCTIAADQAGNANYLAAPQVMQSFTVSVAVAASIAVAGGSPQSTGIGTVYASPLSALVKDVGSNPILGASVTFVLPASGASGTFAGGVTSVTVTTDASGVAVSPAVTANGVVGAFVATATVAAVATPASFSLLNTGGAAYTIVVTPTTPDWQFLTESGTGAGSFVTGPATPPAGTGSVQLQAVTPDGGELFATQNFAGLRLDMLKGLQFSTYVSAGTNAPALDFDVDADLSSPTPTYEGRLVFTPGLLPGAVVPGVWQTWDTMTQKAWYATRAPINATCTLASPCTLATILAAYPNAGVISQLFKGAFGFKLGNNGSTGTVSVDKLVLVEQDLSATQTAWTFDFEPVSPAPASIAAMVGTPQSTPIGTPFAVPLVAQVRDATSQLLSGVTVTFDLPASGASGTFPGGVISASVVTTSVSGEATAPVVTANGIAGTYSATAAGGAATPATFALTNTQGGTTTALGSSLNPSTFGASVTFTATVTPAAATGSVSFYDSATLIGSVVLSGGTATFPTTGLAVGSHPITAVYSGDANYGGSTSSVLTQVVDQASTSTALGSSPNPSNFGQPVTLTATVAPAAATGSVTFLDGATNLGTVALTGGTASIGTSLLAPGSHALTAVYGGDASYAGSTSAPVTQVVNQVAATIAATGGTPQSTPVSTAFGAVLQATVLDAGSNPVPGVTVTFTLPAAGASATFPGAALVANAITNASGVAASPVLTANATAGGYSATATTAGVATTATFSLQNTGTTPALQGAASRKVHGAAGTFDLPLSLLPSNPTTEPRQGPAATIVFTFDKPVNSATASVTEGTATAAPPTFSGNTVSVGLTGVADQQYVTVSLANVTSTDGGTGGSASVRIGFLLGDVNQNRVVTVADLGLVNLDLAQATTATNFLKDLNASGAITVSDKGLANFNLTRALPAP